MKLVILAIGKRHDPNLLKAIDNYTKRVKNYSPVQWELCEAKISSSMDASEIKILESNLLLSKIKPNDQVVLLDETGTQFDSVGLSKRLQQYMNSSTKSLVFIIGGAYGISSELNKRANFVWSLSSLVLPHQLVRLVLIEQLYRAYTILAGEKYHHI